MHLLPKFNPPDFQVPMKDLNSRVKDFFGFWNGYSQYVLQYLNKLVQTIQLEGAPDVPFQAIASAATIRPRQHIQPVTGAIAVATISTPEGFDVVTLLAVDGFTTITTGNIAAAVTVAVGRATTFYLNPIDNQWYS